MKMRSTDLEQDHRIGVKENSAKYPQMIISYGISKQKPAHLRHEGTNKSRFMARLFVSFGT